MGFVFTVAVAVPVYFIANAYRERGQPLAIALTGLERTATFTPSPIAVLPPVWTSTATVTVTSTVTVSPTPTATPTATPSSNAFDFSEAFISSVFHQQNGLKTVITIVVPGGIAGEFRAAIEIGLQDWDYPCVVSGDSGDELLCLGDRLPQSNQAYIELFQTLQTGEEMVFEALFSVPVYFPPTATNTRRPGATKPPANTPTPSNTPTATFTATVTPSNTSPPTNTPPPTNTSPPTNTYTPPPPWASATSEP